MTASVRAELMRLGRWPTTWVLCGTWLVLNLTFGYLFNYLSYRSEDGGGFANQVSEGSAAALLGQMMPESVPVTMVQGLPMFGGALMLILGAVAVGSGYGWGTWKTVFTTGPRRLTAIAGTLGALATFLAGLLVVTLGLDLLAAFAVATAESQTVTWPGLGDTAQGLGAALLISGMWLTAGVLLGTLARGPALAVGLGLVWSLVVENLLRGVAGLLGPLEAVTDVLPGTAAGSLAGALGALTQSDPNGTPGVTTAVGGTAAVALLCAYVMVFLIASLALTVRRDVTS
ncbi:MAG TPA: ABC transporter permease [Pilimelia sp.]|nr:ABC transporter permease [Pilimelia sp.]